MSAGSNRISSRCAPPPLCAAAMDGMGWDGSQFRIRQVRIANTEVTSGSGT